MYNTLRKHINDFTDLGKYGTLDRILLLSTLLSACTIIISVVLVQLFVLLSVILSAVRFVRYRSVNHSSIDLPLALFISARILSVLLSTEIGVSIQALYREIPYYLLFYSAAKFGPVMSKKYIQSIIGVLIIAAVLGSFYGISTVLLGYKPRAESFTSGYYNLGAYLTAVLAIILISGKTSLFAGRRPVWFVTLTLISIAVLFTLNRIHIGIMILLFITIGLIQERKLLILILVVIALILVFSPSVNQRIGQIVHFTEHLGERDILWKGAAQIWKEHPLFGYGPRTFTKIFPYQNELQDSKIGGWHNDYLQVYIESGIIGLVTLFWLIYAIYRCAFGSWKKIGKNDERKTLILAAIVSVTTILLSSLTGSALLDVLIRILFVLLLALLVQLAEYNKTERGHVIAGKET